MCVICLKPIGVELPHERLKECAKANPDGWGIMLAKNGRLLCQKSITLWKGLEAFGTLEAIPLAIHFRTASVGGITQEACHPHRINEELAFMHNGNLFHFSEDGLTDSQVFAQAFPNIRFDYLEDYCRRNYSKMLFMDNHGEIAIINQQAGTWEDGCWYSNGGIEHYTGYGYSGAYEYHEGDVRHKGGVLFVQGFKNKERWVKCQECEGWFFDLQGDFCDDCRSYHDLLKED